MNNNNYPHNINDVASRKYYLVSSTLLALISFIGSLLLAEIYLRLFLRDRVDTEILRSTLEETSIKSLIQPSENPNLYFELKPNLNTDFRGALVISSHTGYRISAQAIETPPGAIRVAVLGDSTSFGWRVDYADTYPEWYRRQMEADIKVPVELRNYSVPGYNSKQELHLFLDRIAADRPNLLILHYDHNDPQPTGLGYPPNYIPPEYGDNPLNSTLIKFALRQLREFQNQNNFTFNKDDHEYFDGYIISGPLYDEHLLALQQLARETQSLNIPTIVVIFNVFVWAEENLEESQRYILLHKNLSIKLERMGFYVLDLYPFYQVKMREMNWSDLSDWWISKEPMDAHPNPVGHQFIADRLVEYTHLQPALIKIFKEHQTTMR